MLYHSSRPLRTALAAALSLSASMALAADPVKLGLLEDASGNFAIATIGKIHATELAVEEINAKGGILGRPIKLIAYDTQSDNTKFQELARRLIQTDKADVIFGGFSSASREAIRPIMDRAKQLYWYNNQYEGGVCDSNVFVTGAVPEQQFSTLIPWMMEKYGKRVYTIAADYNFGQISAEWVRDIVKRNGGEMVGEEFIPLSVSQFGQTIQNIQKAKPSFVMTLLVGANQASYYEQQAAANLNLPMGSSVNVGQAYEHKRFKAPALKDMHVTANYVEEVDSPASAAFKQRFRAKFPNEPYINQEAANAYDAVYLYKAAVERAKSTDQQLVRKALEEGGICTDGPSGKVCIDPKSHHLSHTIYLVRVKDDHSVEIPKVWNDVQPYWLGEAGCNLPAKPDQKQYTPSNPPKKS
ncbi:urea ABC transporter substrate-binding protein [Achromobacter sp. Marseille-Q0513]|jgi:branched-chain amino acid transport system substrate-binding protein|uniref:urea ABC transporter substrate-binding protein n=1 Tax=Achromobacter sp. Marseille-Q0513 TaxID=2829161 RepID=UPI001B98FB55|nr:urea ABC transporter substrate-binding protein [Achromobacter sp. Marseille-Q0513]MBR8655900.1 urea ABC transporter substrate-binding protein [Achromobacter sp. Marseille-Q0513]